ncbi:MAG: ribosome silencing factor [Parafilimonas sp.]
MEPLTALASRKKSTITRLNTNSRIFKLILKAIQEKKGENIIALDLRKIPEAVSDFFVICDASSTTQVRAVADFIEDTIKKELGENPYRHEGYNVLQWVLIDYVNIVVHVMLPATRKFYKLEEMWSDAVLHEY